MPGPEGVTPSVCQLPSVRQPLSVRQPSSVCQPVFIGFFLNTRNQNWESATFDKIKKESSIFHIRPRRSANIPKEKYKLVEDKDIPGNVTENQLNRFLDEIHHDLTSDKKLSYN